MAPKERPVINIEPENNPDAVIRWYHLTSESNSHRQCALNRDLSAQAKKHLCYLGWTFSHVNKQGRWELRYRSPISGKNFISLRRACLACIEEGGCNDVNDPLVQQNNIDQQHPSSSSAPKRPRKCKKKKRQRGGKGKVLSTLERVLDGSDSSRRATTISWLIDRKVVGLDSLVSCRGDNNPEKKGKIIRSGIVCDCCNMIFSATRFEAHAGCRKHRPTSNIFLEDGRSLRDCKREALTSQKNVKEEERGQRECKNDSICFVCRYGGALVNCDECPASFHLSCSGLDVVPQGKWFCHACCCKICKRLKCSKDCANDEDVKRALVCHQCQRRFHSGCLKDLAFTEIGKDNYLGRQNYFCSGSCKNIFFSLQKLIGKPIQVGENMTCTLLKSVKSDNSGRPELTWEEVDDLIENERKLHVAVGILRESFAPVIDEITGADFIAGIVFSKSSKTKRLNFEGFYTMLMEMEKEVICVVTVRVLGKRFAEIPFVATKEQFRKQGICRSLMRVTEKQLTDLGVEKIILPSSDTKVDTWTNSFGFARMELSDTFQLLGYAFLEFKGTIMCHKTLGSE